MATTMLKALNQSLHDALSDDEKVILLGEDIGTLGGVFRVTDGLKSEFGEHRVVDTPLAESGIVGSAIGLAYRGYRPVVEIQFDGFTYPAFDQLVSQLAKLHYRSRGRVKMPVTVRIPYGGGIGSPEHHSESPEAYFAHTAGLRVFAPSSVQDAYTMLRQAIDCDDPVIFFEPKRRYHEKADIDLSTPAKDGSPKAKVVREGEDVTIVGYGPTTYTLLEAALAAEDEGVSLEVIDLRTLDPLDIDTVANSVKHTGKLVVVHEASRTSGVGAEICAQITETCFDYLEHAPLRVTGFDIPYPPSRLESHHLPDLDRVMHAVDTVMRHHEATEGAAK
ncbi:pyruvate dehydrogenase E1 component beta subunit [Glutamicibacter uratoxydans]|uniref:Pyruvate dehydrogenase E1 component beta subunit n=1 Tax=Glutamicibacter uratoxydans TaxID=43667 RepID=A0A4Y4DQD7_GLUUR|nr:alpha-ketoacid dehydrogenase subunit beta [Glutamicibacter uratoxydans]GED06823.1 pyruvate dehydrogenase E1 component beta subunit [Glutamicibacter uratoxydans]